MATCAQPDRLPDGKHASVEVWAIRTATDLRTCAERHAALVAAQQRREALYK